MVEALKIHSILFEITDRMGYGRDLGLVIAVCMFAIFMLLDCIYVLFGSKRYLIVGTGFGLICTLSMYMAAIKVNLSDKVEVLQIVHMLIEAMVFNIIITLSCHLFKMKLLDPIAERISQKEFEQFLMEEGIRFNSPEAVRLQTAWEEKNLIKTLNNVDFALERTQK